MFALLVSLLTFAAYAALVIHVIRGHRPGYWIIVIVLFPVFGGLLYVVLKVLPDLRGKPGSRSLSRVDDATSDSVSDSGHARALLDAGNYADAIRDYEAMLTGENLNDPDLLLGLAEAQFAAKAYGDAKGTLERLHEENPNFQSAAGHLLYARALQHCGFSQKALREFEAVSAYFPGAEARYRFAALLENEGDREQALEQFRRVAQAGTSDQARDNDRHWIDRAGDAVRRLQS